MKKAAAPLNGASGSAGFVALRLTGLEGLADLSALTLMSGK
jgi:hypothetical protein